MNKVFRHYIPASTLRLLPNRWDLVALPLVIGFLLFFSITARETWAPIATLQSEVISLDPANLPEYAMRTTLRMLAAMVAALVFTLLYGTLAAKSRRAEKLLVPVLDILQSVPVLGYISFTVTFFLLLFPGRVLGAECADDRAYVDDRHGDQARRARPFQFAFEDIPPDRRPVRSAMLDRPAHPEPAPGVQRLLRPDMIRAGQELAVPHLGQNVHGIGAGEIAAHVVAKGQISRIE